MFIASYICLSKSFLLKLRQYYSQWGTVVDCIVIRDPQTKYSRGFGFVTFATIQMAEAAMADRPHTINNKVCIH